MALRVNSLLGLAALYVLASGTAVPKTSHLRKRDTERHLNSISCGTFSSADNLDSYDNIDWLNDQDHAVYVAGRTCLRERCKNTSGIFICNDNIEGINVQTTDVAAFADLITYVCGSGSGEGSHATNGQIFTSDSGGYNVVVGYANCNDDPTGTILMGEILHCLRHLLIFDCSLYSETFIIHTTRYD
jgi:hypothetical protein